MTEEGFVVMDRPSHRCVPACNPAGIVHVAWPGGERHTCPRCGYTVTMLDDLQTSGPGGPGEGTGEDAGAQMPPPGPDQGAP